MPTGAIGAFRLRCFFLTFFGGLGIAFRLPAVPGGAGGVASSARHVALEIVGGEIKDNLASASRLPFHV